MSLPKLEHPTFTIVLPSTKQEIVFRPFLVKEEKILLVAHQAADPAGVIRAIKQVINNCIVAPKIDVNTFTTFDLEYFFIKLRAKSVNNIVSLTYRDNEDNKEYKFEIDLDKLEIESTEDHTNIVSIDRNMQLILKYPLVDMIDTVPTEQTRLDFSFDVLKQCLDKLIVTKAGSEEEVFVFSSYSQAEIQEFLMSLSHKSFQAVQKFFDTMPHLEHVLKYTNEKGNERTIKLRKLDDFFSLG